MKRDTEINQNRRDVIKGLATGAVLSVFATSVSAAANTTEITPSRQAQDNNVKQTRYRETQHVRDYYNTL
ncbi:twin-arginine translocation signal domain-containing protein [Vibrio sp. SM6]|uniref:Twin-arginine translocation signal domain-containing protein n=1 Tax=Vibrio agarilyticus TaxID=2726741 RepID=A0A7X8YGP8_9VIBR|nr:twin-arginine translocation signal domain-containing protein [Vibrio agarilyticus]NLS12592.1 twin-arginine translocation signal domain-containing protein [Vibrio agarilyticus]